MKKTLLILLCVLQLSVPFVAACNSTPSQESQQESENASTPAEESKEEGEIREPDLPRDVRDWGVAHGE